MQQNKPGQHDSYDAKQRMTRAPSLIPEIAAICDECAQPRRATSRTFHGSRGDWRRLKCAHCKRVTLHRRAQSWSGDWGEGDNRKADEKASRFRRHLEDITALFARSGIHIMTSDEPTQGIPCRPSGGIVDVIRWIAAEQYVVRLHPDLTLRDRIVALEWAWIHLIPSKAKWDELATHSLKDGRRYQLFYNPIKEDGSYRPRL